MLHKNQNTEHSTDGLNVPQRKNATRQFLKVLFVFLLISFFTTEQSNATHFRYGNITWTLVSGRTVNFQVAQGWRLSAFGVGLGDPVAAYLEMGDGTFQFFDLTVTSVNLAEDWFYAEGSFVYTYPGNVNNFTALFNGCCRISTLSQGNNDLAFQISTHVTLGNGNNSPVASMPPIVNVGVNGNPSTFQLAASDPDGDPLTYRLSTPSEMGDLALTNPAGLSINSTGLVSWNTMGLTLGSLYMVQFTVEDNHGASIGVDLILRLNVQTNPPTFDYTATPTNGQIYFIQPLQPLCFTVKAVDSDPGDIVTLSAIGVPVGAVLSPGLPTSGNPVSSTFCWTPTNSQLGSRVVNFTAQDVNGSQTNTSVTIVVSTRPVFDVPPTPPANQQSCIQPGTPFQAVIKAHAPDPLGTVSITSATIPSNATLSPATPTPVGNITSTILNWTPQVSNWGINTFSFTATDNVPQSTTHSFSFIVNTPPTFLSSQSNTSIQPGQLFSYSMTWADADIIAGDVVNVISPSLPAWLTINPTGPTTAMLSGTPSNADVGNHSITLELEDLFHHCSGPILQNFNIAVVNECLTLSATFLPILCHGGTTCVTITATGGTGNYLGSGIICNVPAGTTTFPVTDLLANCTATINVTIGEPDKLTVTTSSTPASCAGNDGSATAAGADGTPGYTYFWPSINVSGATAGSLAPGNYVVVVTDANGCTASTTATVMSAGTTPGAAGTISGPVGICKGQCVTYSISPVPNAASYVWVLPRGATGSSTTNSITVCGTSKLRRNGFICVYAVNQCGQGLSSCMGIKLYKDKPKTPSSILGPTVICRGTCATFSIAPIADAVSYTWVATGGLTISSPQGSTSIVICAPANAQNSGQVKVYATNCKGNSGTKTRNVTVSPETPGAINGNATICHSAVNKHYSVPAVAGALSYNWTASNGVTIASGQGTKDVYLTFTASVGTSSLVSVTITTQCGNSAPSTKTVAINNCKESIAVSGSNAGSINSLIAYPNPTSGNFTLTLNSASDIKYMIRAVDLTGRVILSESWNATEGENTRDISLTGIAKGMYYIQLINEGSEQRTLPLIIN